MESQWTVEANGKSFGPYTTDQLVRLAQSGQVKPFHMVRRDGGPLVACAEVKGLFDGLGQGSSGHRLEATPQDGLFLPPTVQAPPVPPAMAPGYYAAPGAQTYGAQQYAAPQYGAQPMAHGYAAPQAAVPTPPAPSAPAKQAFSAGTTSGRRKSSSSAQFITTAAAILIGAAAAILIYINLEPLEKRILGSGKREEPDVIVVQAPPAPQVTNNRPVATNNTPAPPPPPAVPANAARTNDPAARPVIVPPMAENPGTENPGTLPAVNGTAGATPQPVFDAGRSIVQLRAPGQSQAAAGSGFAVNDRGMIATSLGAHKVGSSLTAYFQDGATAEVVGFVAVAPDRDLVLLKLSAIATKPLPQARSGAAAGTPIFTAGSSRSGSTSFATSHIEITRRLDMPIQSLNRPAYLSAGTHVSSLRNVVSTVARGGPVINAQGEFVGVMSIAPDGDQYVIDGRHVAELIASAGDIARPLAELDQLRGAAIVAVPPAGAPRVFPNVRNVANNGPGPAAPQPQAPAAGTSGWLQTLDSIYARRNALVATREQAQAAIKPLLPELAKLELDYKAREPQYLRAKFEWDDNERRIAQLTASTVNDVPNSLQRNNLAVRIDDRSYLRSNLNFEESRIGTVKTEYEAVKKRIEDYNAQLATVYKEADTLRKDFLNHLDPFGPPSKELGAEGVKYFTEKIPVERDTSFAYLGRAAAYLKQGDNRLAILDLDEAVKAAPEKSIFLTVRGVAHARAGDLAQGRKDLSDAIRQDDKNAWCRFQYCLILCRTEAYTLIEQQLRECMKIAPANPDAFTMMALLKSSTADDKFRNADYALRMAQSAYDMSTAKTWDTSMALAAAHAEKGDFDKAVEYAEKSVAAAGERQAAWCRDCLKTFQEKKPLRIDWKTFDLQAMK